MKNIPFRSILLGIVVILFLMCMAVYVGSGKTSELKQSVYSANLRQTVKDTNCNRTSCHCVYSYRTKWEENTDVCNGCFDFVKSRLKTRYGIIPIYVYQPKEDVFVSASIIKTGAFDGAKIEQLLNYLKADPSLNFIDIGANLGVFSLNIAKSGRKVLAVEALYKNVQHLCMSIRDAGLQNNLKVIHNALSDKSGMVVNLGVDVNNMGGTFVDFEAENTKKLKKEYNLKVEGTYGSVRTFTLDNLLELEDMKDFKNVIMKMDIEGFEYKALLGGQKFFDSVDIKAIFMEWLFHKQKKSGKGIIEFLTKRHFVPYSDDGKRELNIAKFEWWDWNILWLKKN